jgi:hypothetical protein
LCIQMDVTNMIILIAGHYCPAHQPYGLVYLWGHYMTLASLRGTSLT